MIPDSELKRGSGHKAELSNTINIKDGCLRLWALTYIQKKRIRSGEIDQPFIPPEPSAQLIPYSSGRLLTDLPHNPFYLFFSLFLSSLVPGQWVPPHKEFRYVSVDSKHMCYISPRSWEQPPPLLFGFVSPPRCYWEPKRKYEESILLGFFCLPPTEHWQTNTWLSLGDDANSGIRFLASICRLTIVFFSSKFIWKRTRVSFTLT